VALAGCSPGARGDRTPHVAGGGWLPYLESIQELQWDEWVEPYWSDVAEFAMREHPQLLVCLELHPGTAVYNVETFDRIAALGDSIAANIAPCHFLCLALDQLAVLSAIGDRVGHYHRKDVQQARPNLAVNGGLDIHWQPDPSTVPWI